jgi:hypothetical protein
LSDGLKINLPEFSNLALTQKNVAREAPKLTARFRTSTSRGFARADDQNVTFEACACECSRLK